MLEPFHSFIHLIIEVLFVFGMMLLYHLVFLFGLSEGVLFVLSSFLIYFIVTDQQKNIEVLFGLF